MADTAERDALAAKYFPRQWAKVAQAPGRSKQRQQLRHMAERALLTGMLRAEGACCGNCDGFGTASIGGKSETICWADSDFHGYALTDAGGICYRWHKKEAVDG